MTLQILDQQGNERIATVFVGRTASGKLIEFVESFQPPLPIEKKWVNVLSVMAGCPVHCQMCDAGQNFGGNLSKEEILQQVDYLVRRRFANSRIATEKWKIQFTRMGEPAYNNAVLDVLEELPEHYPAARPIPSVSSVAPAVREAFFERLREIKNRCYPNGRFQLQFSIHTTDEQKRDRLIPIKKWNFEKIADYGKRFFEEGDRKITLNFALMGGYPLEPTVLKRYFDPTKFLVKITPLNPTQRARENELRGALDPTEKKPFEKLANDLRQCGFDTIVSIGNTEENQIGSNCGQFVSGYLRKTEATSLSL